MTKRWGPNLRSDLTATKRSAAKRERREAHTEALALSDSADSDAAQNFEPIWVVGYQEWEEFVSLLAKPAAPNTALRMLMQSSPVWR